MQASTPDPGRRNEQSRLAVLDAAIALVGELGYDNVSVEAIARRAGVGKQTIYRWWPSKGAVVLEAVATRSMAPVVEFPDTGELVADLRTHLEGVVDLLANTHFGAAYRGLVAAGQSDPALLRALFDQVIEPNLEALGGRIAAAQELGEVRADADPEMLRDLLYGVFEYRLVHLMPTESRYIEAILGIVFDGVRPPGS